MKKIVISRLLNSAIFMALLVGECCVSADEGKKAEGAPDIEIQKLLAEPRHRLAFQYLLVIDVWCYDCRQTGLKCSGREAVQVLYELKNAEVFEYIFNNATLEGRVYALAALYYLDKKKFEAFYLEINEDEVSLSDIRVCGEENGLLYAAVPLDMSSVANSKDLGSDTILVNLDGYLDFTDWIAKNHSNFANKIVLVDMRHGGISSLIVFGEPRNRKLILNTPMKKPTGE